MAEGLPLKVVLDALGISRPTYSRRIRKALQRDTLIHVGEAIVAVRRVNF